MEHFAWPLAALIFGIVFFVMFRIPISGFLSRVSTVGRDGVSATPLPEQRPIEQQKEASTGKDVQTMLQAFDSPALLQQERIIVADLEARQLDSTSDTTKVLVRNLAKHQLFLGCEVVYRLIFGSQIIFLKRLNTVSGISEADATEFYAAVVQQHPDTFPPEEPERYFSFLFKQGLAVIEESQYSITDFGREFLAWLVQGGVDEFKTL